MTALLAAYREEGVASYPLVFLLSTTEHLSVLAPGTAKVVVGTKPLAEVRAAGVLKECALLAADGWAIYVGKCGSPAKWEYGLFRSLANTCATSAEETMVQETGTTGILAIRNRGHLVVALRNVKDETLTVALTPAPAMESRFAQDVQQLVDASASDLDADVAASYKPYLRRFLADVLQRCHGTLCAVVKPPESGIAPSQFSKSVWLPEPLRWSDVHGQARAQKTADALARLQGLESLVVGMISCDGIIVFGTDGTVRGYRAFLSPNEAERQRQEADGGGRRRTFALMESRLGTELRAAFFRSQDGETQCTRVTQ